MALTYTPNAEVGHVCPEFDLPAVDGSRLSLADCASTQALVVMFICSHCPYVQAIEDRLIKLGHAYPKNQVQLIGICSNDWTEHPEDSPQELYRRWKEKNYSFPYLVDEDQSIAKAFGAVCTPDIFVFDQQRRLTYRGRLDDSWKSPQQVERQDLKEAIDLTLKKQPVAFEQIPSMGCSIKWKQ